MVKQLETFRETICFGDFNINQLDRGNKQKLQSVMAKFSFQQVTKGPTRNTRQANMLIDLMFTNRPERLTET